VLGSFQVTGTVAVRGSHTPPPLTASGTTCRHWLRQEIGGSKTASSFFSSVSMLLFFYIFPCFSVSSSVSDGAVVDGGSRQFLWWR
jgi:hypothetical protein